MLTFMEFAAFEWRVATSVYACDDQMAQCFQGFFGAAFGECGQAGQGLIFVFQGERAGVIQSADMLDDLADLLQL